MGPRVEKARAPCMHRFHRWNQAATHPTTDCSTGAALQHTASEWLPFTGKVFASVHLLTHFEKCTVNLCSQDASASRFLWSFPEANAAPHQSRISPRGASDRWRYPCLSKFPTSGEPTPCQLPHGTLFQVGASDSGWQTRKINTSVLLETVFLTYHLSDSRANFELSIFFT